LVLFPKQLIHAEDQPRYNVAPASHIQAIRQIEADRELVRIKWGLVPHWSVEPETSYSTFNAKAETVDANKELPSSSKPDHPVTIGVHGDWGAGKSPTTPGNNNSGKDLTNYSCFRR
jgi:hypothetical protein